MSNFNELKHIDKLNIIFTLIQFICVFGVILCDDKKADAYIIMFQFVLLFLQICAIIDSKL